MTLKLKLSAANHEKTQLAEKLKAAESTHHSAEAGLKIAEPQAEDQRKQLYTSQINLATEKAAVLDLKAKLLNTQEALKVAQEAAKAVETAAYERGILEMEARLTAEVMVVCRDYCTETYFQALDLAGIPVEFDLRRADQVYYPEDIREDPTAFPPPAALPLPPPEQPLTIPNPSQGIEIPTGVPKEKKGDGGSLGQKRRQRRRRRRRQRIKPMPIPSRTPLQLKTWYLRLKLLNPSPRLTLRRILINHRLKYRVLALFLRFLVLFDATLIFIIQ